MKANKPYSRADVRGIVLACVFGPFVYAAGLILGVGGNMFTNWWVKDGHKRFNPQAQPGPVQ